MSALKMSWIFLLFLTFANGARILGVFPSPGYSQFILAEKLMTALTERGHEVTVISPYAPKTPPKSYKTISTNGVVKSVVKTMHNLYDFLDYSHVKALLELHLSFSVPMTEYTLAEPEVQKLITSNATFDVVIVEQFANVALLGFAHHFKSPLILFSSIGACEWTNDLVGNVEIPSYVPSSYTGYTTNMNFIQRAKNMALTAFESLLKEFVVYPKHNKLLQQYFPGSPRLEDVIYNASLVLLNSHPAVWDATPLVPSMIEIGGFHIEHEEVPKELKKFLDDAREGVVFFSMGSNLRSKDLSTEMLNGIMQAFSKLKQKVLWKFENENLPGLPKNVKISKWLPQRAVLGHPNTKAFISHCGFISTIESVFYGVPRICIPIFGDQNLNAAFMEKTETGVRLGFRDVNQDNLGNALHKVLNDKKYAENSKRGSRVMQDRPVKPLDLAMYWIEYVIRHGGAPHLRTASLELKWYQRWMLDILCVVIILAIVLLKTVFVIVRIIKECFKGIDKTKKNK